MATETAPAEELSGLTEDEARRRLAARGKPPKPPTSRSYWTIVRGNTFTLPNILLGVLGIATLALGQTADALFLGVVIANVVIGSVQEIRAKRALDRLAALVRPEARVIRGGTERSIAAGEVVVGDLVALQPGDQVVADGTLATSDGLRLDESMLTGESDPVVKSPGAQVLSGAFAVEGVGRFEVTAVGQDSYAEQLTGQARTFRHPTSPFQRGLGRLILTLVTLGVPLVLALSIAEWLRGSSFEDGFSAVVAGAIVLIPEGLILLASIVYVTGALKMSRHGALVQQLNAVESLASANVVCTDKTGTLTEPRLRVVSVVPAAADEQELRHAFGRYAASSEVRNSTLEALAEAFPAPVETPSASIPFSSRWKWSAVELADGGLVLGAPELFPLGSVADAAGSEAASGRRVVAIASTSERPQRHRSRRRRSRRPSRSRPRDALGGAAAQYPGDGRLLPGAGDRAQGAVRRRAVHGRHDRETTPASPASGRPRTAPSCRRARRSSRRCSAEPPSSGESPPRARSGSSRRCVTTGATSG